MRLLILKMWLLILKMSLQFLAPIAPRKKRKGTFNLSAIELCQPTMKLLSLTFSLRTSIKFKWAKSFKPKNNKSAILSVNLFKRTSLITPKDAKSIPVYSIQFRIAIFTRNGFSGWSNSKVVESISAKTTDTLLLMGWDKGSFLGSTECL